MTFDLAREPLEAAASRAAALFVDVYRGLEARRVDPGRAPAELDPVFRDTLTDEGVGLLAALDEFESKVLPAAMGTAHPLYLGLVNCSPLPGAALADLLVSALNNNNSGAFGQGPAAGAAERELVNAFARLCFGDDAATGMILPGGSYATLQGLVLARTRHFPEWRRGGPAAVSGAPIVCTSEASHFSVARAALVMGIGEDGVVSVPTTGRGAMDVTALGERIEEHRRAGARPFAVVATTGTTGTGAIDPAAAIAECCRRHDLWLHVDACYGGGALLVDELRSRFGGSRRPTRWRSTPASGSSVRSPPAFSWRAIPPPSRPRSTSRPHTSRIRTRTTPSGAGSRRRGAPPA